MDTRYEAFEPGRWSGLSRRLRGQDVTQQEVLYFHPAQIAACERLNLESTGVEIVESPAFFLLYERRQSTTHVSQQATPSIGIVDQHPGFQRMSGPQSLRRPGFRPQFPNSEYIVSHWQRARHSSSG
jgi:hypothetical protein